MTFVLTQHLSVIRNLTKNVLDCKTLNNQIIPVFCISRIPEVLCLELMFWDEWMKQMKKDVRLLPTNGKNLLV